MQKLHIVPSSLHFIRSQQNGVAYTDTTHYLQFDTNAISFKPLTSSENYLETINLILSKFQATLRIYKDKYCHRLVINFFECPHLDKTALNAVGLAIANHFRNLYDLKLNFCRCENIKEEGIHYLINAISKSLRNLRNLELSFVSCPNIDDKGAGYIRRLILQRLKHLEKLSLNFSAQTSEIPGRVTIPFQVNIMQRLQTLKKLLNGMDYIQVNSMTLKGSLLFYSRISQYLYNLQEFTVIIPPMMSDQDYGKEVIRSVIPRLRRLRKLHFCSYMEDSDIQEMSLYIGKKWHQLQHLTLEIIGSSSALKEETVRNLMTSALINSPELHGFCFSLDRFRDITYEHIYHVFAQICLYAKELKILTLDFTPVADISNKVIRKLIVHLSQNLSRLEELTLNFQESNNPSRMTVDIPNQLTFGSLKKLYLYLCEYDFTSDPDPLVYSKTLEELGLFFSECLWEMFDSCFEKLLLKISQLKGLQCLSLLFSHASLITDKAIDQLCSMKWNNYSLSTLKRLTFGISRNKTLTDVALCDMSSWITENFKELTHLEIIFRACLLVSEFGIMSFMTKIARNLRKLESLSLDFFQDGPVSESVMDYMADEIVKHLKDLRELTLTLIIPRNVELENLIIQMRKKLRFISVLNLHFSLCLQEI